MQPEEVYALGAFALGALHAFEPGHGKTIMAAYLVGTRGRPLDAVILGIVVTFTHTFTIILLAVGLTFAREQVLAAHTHVLLQIGSGAAVLAVGLWMLWRELSGRPAGHSHSHVHSHSHDGHTHGHHEHVSDTAHSHEEASGREAKSTEGDQRLRMGGLIAVGVSGGLVPCPGAIAVLLTAVNRGEVVGGLVLTLLFSLGTASVLVAIGLLLVTTSEWAERRFRHGVWERWAPLASAVVVTLLGLALLVGSVLHSVMPHDKMKETFDRAALLGGETARADPSRALGTHSAGMVHGGGLGPRHRRTPHPPARSQWGQIAHRDLPGRRRGGADVRILWRLCRYALARPNPRAA